ncbi:hypothetical protein niasHS_017928 [Heterodera schachtii]|uniref:BTB domain-containing protein n=1 Tax=Heterodera schachtii TaxID=97005 RepID=A0ABD2HYU9_HETSC
MSMETIEKLVEMHGEVETKCAKMGDDIIGKLFKLYDRYNFVVRIVVIVDKWTTDKRAWANIGHEKRITELFEVSYPFSQLDEEELSKSEEIVFLDTSVAFVGNKYKMRIIHAENVKKMVKESPVFRDFLCKNSDDFETNIKPSLEQMVGSSELIRLEDQFPEALRIDIMSQQTLLEIYRQILPPAMNEEAVDDGKYGSKKIFTREKRAQKQLETELKKWEMNKCETEQEQKQTMDEFRQKELNSRFKQDILALLETGGKQKTKMGEILAKDGAKSGLVELIEWKQYNELDDGGHLLGIFPSNGFQNDERLFKHYKEAITHKKSSVVSVKNKMSADLIAFLRFLHVYIMAELNLQILWHKMHKLFELEYDRLFREEDNLVKLLKIERQLEEMIMETSDFLKKEIKEKQLKNATKFVDENLRNKWEKKMDKCQGKSGPNLAKGSRYSEKEQLMEKLHLREMLNLLKQKNSSMKLEEKNNITHPFMYGYRNGRDHIFTYAYGCPKKSKKPEELAAIDKANQVEEEMIMNFFEYFKLENNQRESADNEKECHSIEMDTLAWHLKYQIKSLKGTSNWKKIEQIFSDKNREIKLCRIYTHFEYVTKREKGILYAGFADEQMLSAQNDEQFFEWLNRKCSTDDRLFVANAIHTVCSNRLQVREANFMAFRHLLLSSQQFRAYFCKLANSSQNNYVENKIYDAEIWCDDGWTKVCFEVQKIGEVKEKILALIGDEKMLLLEAQFPEVLKIDAIMLQTQPFLYKNILAHKSHTDEAKFWSARLGIAHLVQMVNAMLSNFGLSVSFEFEIKYGFTVKSRDIFCEAFKHLTQQKFRGGIGRTLCALVQFKNYAQTFYEVFSAANDRLNLEAIAKWRPKCAENEEQDKAYQQMTKSLATQNGTMLKNLIIGNDEFKKFVQNTRGARARIGKLLVSAEEHQKFLEFCGERIRNEKVFTDQWLMELYLEFLNKFAIMDTERQMRYFLSLSYSVWVRWMDRQIDPKNANLPIGLRQIYEQIWKNQRIQYEQIAYDKIFDVNSDELVFEFALILKVFEPLKKFVETKRNEKNLRKFGIEITKRNNDKNSPQKQHKEHIEKSEKLLEQWEAIWTNAKQNIRIWKTTECQTTECHTTQCQEEKLKMARPTECLQTLHFDTLMDFLENKAMQSQLKNGLKKRREILKKWLMQFMGKEMVEKIQLAIQLNNEQIGEMRKKQKEKKEISEEKQKIYEENLGNLEKELAEEEEKEQKKKEEKMAKEKEQKKKEKEKMAKEKEQKEKKMAKEKEQKKKEKEKMAKEKEQKEKEKEKMAKEREQKEKEKVAKEKEQKEKMKIKPQKRKAKKEEEEKQKEREKSSEVTKSSGNLGKSAETIGKEKGKKERDANSIEIGDEAEGDELEDGMANIGLKGKTNRKWGGE